MKCIINRALLAALAFILCCGFFTQVQAQSYTLKVGEAVPAWLFEDATYDIVKQKLIQYYGQDKENWPLFIREVLNLSEQYEEFNAKQESPDQQHYLEFFHTELGLGVESHNSEINFGAYHQNYKRNYFNIFAYYYPGVLIQGKYLKLGDSEWHKLLNTQDELDEVQLSYLNASKTDGILAALFHMYARYCPLGLINWYFEEVIPMIDLLYKQESKEALESLLNREISKQVFRYSDNHEYQKADDVH